MKTAKKGKNEPIRMLIYTKARQEMKANENLQRQGFKTSITNNTIQLIKDKLEESGLYKEAVTKVDYREGDLVSIKEGGCRNRCIVFI